MTDVVQIQSSIPSVTIDVGTLLAGPAVPASSSTDGLTPDAGETSEAIAARTAAIQSIIDDCGTIVLPDGVYQVNELYPSGRVTVVGESKNGVILYGAAGTEDLFQPTATCTRLTLRDISVANTATVVDVKLAGSALTIEVDNLEADTSEIAIRATDAAISSRVITLKIKGLVHDGNDTAQGSIYIKYKLGDSLIKDCELSNLIKRGIQLGTDDLQPDDRGHARILNNKITSVNWDSGQGDHEIHPIWLYGGTCDIALNTLETTTGGQDGTGNEGIYTKVKSGRIHENRLKNCGWAQIMIKDTATMDWGEAEVLVENNTVWRNTPYLDYQDEEKASCGICAYTGRVTMRNNYVRGCIQGYRIDGGYDDIVVEDNKSWQCRMGIYARNFASNCVIRNNTLLDCGDASIGTIYGIQINPRTRSTQEDNFICEGNIILNGTASSTTIGIFVYTLTTGTATYPQTGIVVRDNYVDGYDEHTRITDGATNLSDFYDSWHVETQNSLEAASTVYTLEPQYNADQNQALLQTLLDNTAIKTLIFKPGTYDYNFSVHLHGEKNIIGGPGVIWRPDYDTINDGAYDAGGATHKTSFIAAGVKDVTTSPLITWTGIFSGIEFQSTTNTVWDRVFWLHDVADIIIQDIKIDLTGDTTAQNDQFNGLTTSGANAQWIGSGGWGTGVNNVIVEGCDIRVIQNTEPQSLGGECFAFRGVAQYDTVNATYQHITIRNNYCEGFSDDWIAIHHCKDARVHDNRCKCPQSRILINGTPNTIVANNYMELMESRSQGWDHCNWIEFHHTDGISHLRTITGTHDGGNGATTLSDSDLSDYDLATDQLKYSFIWNTDNDAGGWIMSNTGTTITARYEGTHTGSNGSSDLVDGNADFADDCYNGMTVNNITKSESATITDVHTGTTVVGTLSGSATWDQGDEYYIELEWDTGEDFKIGQPDPQNNCSCTGNVMIYPKGSSNGEAHTAIKVCASNVTVTGNTVHNYTTDNVYLFRCHDLQVNASQGQPNTFAGKPYRQPEKVVCSGNTGISYDTGQVLIGCLTPTDHHPSSPWDWEQDCGDITIVNNACDALDLRVGRVKYHGNSLAGGNINVTAAGGQEVIPDGVQTVEVTSDNASNVVRLPYCLEGTGDIKIVVKDNGFELAGKQGYGDKINGTDCGGSSPPNNTLVIPANSFLVCKTTVVDQTRTPTDKRLANWIVTGWNYTTGAALTLSFSS